MAFFIYRDNETETAQVALLQLKVYFTTCLIIDIPVQAITDRLFSAVLSFSRLLSKLF